MNENMTNGPLFNFGKAVNFPLMNLDLLLEGGWDLESDKSSEISIIPTSGLIKKRKSRRLDNAVYEAFTNLFFSELCREYNNLFNGMDLSLYSPQTVIIQYGEEGNKASSDSSIYQIFCPGTPLNKIKKSRVKNLMVGSERVRIEDRIMYLGGVLSEILLKEGIIHDDPQMRHFLLLPEKSYSCYIDGEGDLIQTPVKNGLGIIDVENARVLGSCSNEVKKDAEEFKTNLFRGFNHTPNAENYFDQGVSLVSTLNLREMLAPHALTKAKMMWDSFFPGSKVKHVDMESKRVTYN